ncbi:MAG: histidine phosphatase family protein [Oscillospiraceae bacterium]|nr:histidine phosphatase family protein [Oscillospiraceae bacterium]MCR4761099.1 histidine phosphatase family protein [Oscillospiraceae bacterium]
MKNYHISLIRHGRTDANDRGQYIGTTDYPLNDRGRNELYDKLDRFVYPKVELVYSSPLQRCTETAEILFPHKEMKIAEDFRELHFGQFEGKTASELLQNEDYRTWLKGGMDVKPPEGESVAELSVRTYQGLYKILLEMMQEDLQHAALVTHAGVISNILTCFGLPKLDPKQIQTAPGEGFEIQINPQMWQQAQAFEILGVIPFLPEESETF